MKAVLSPGTEPELGGGSGCPFARRLPLAPYAGGSMATTQAGIARRGTGDRSRSAERTAGLALRHARLFLDEVVPGLAASGVHLLRWPQLEARQRDSLTASFEEHIFPVLTPLAVDPGHPFPYISNLSLNLAVR